MDIKEANRLARCRYRQTEKGGIAERRYRQSRKGKATRLQSVLRYQQTEKGKKVKKAADKRYYEKNKGKIHEQQRKYNRKYWKTESYKLIHKISNANRRYFKKVSDGITTQQWEAKIREYNYRCAYCGRLCHPTMDHIIPLSKGGKHSLSNIVPACAECNNKKGTKSNWMPKVFRKEG